MRFEFIWAPSNLAVEVEVWFKSSKEEVLLGVLKFLDSDKDEREDIARLLRVVLEHGVKEMVHVV